jgi:hypothetical protein
VNPCLFIAQAWTVQRLTRLLAWCLLLEPAPVVQQGRTPDLYSGGVGSKPAGGLGGRFRA